MMFRSPIAILTLICTCLIAPMNLLAANLEGQDNPTERADVQQFIRHMVNDYHFNADKLTKLFAKAKLHPRVIATIHHPAEQKPWYKYRQFFMTQNRIDQGVLFWQAHKEALAQAEKEYGVPAKIILGIMGVETFYGSRTGTYPALDALATLAFNYPERSKFFTYELEQFLLLAREQHFDSQHIKSSYAGALGFPQFMPSSYRQYSVDYSGDHINDLFHNADDSIGSIANYLAKKGKWHRNEPLLIAVTLPAQSKITIPRRGTEVMTVAAFEQLGIEPDQQYKQLDQLGQLKGKAFQVKQENGLQTYIGLHNFKAILSYNPRINYGMAVVTLADALEQAYHATHD